MRFKKTLITLLLLSLGLAWLWFSALPGLVTQRIESYLTQAGYKPQSISQVMVRPPYVLASDIALDSYGFNSIGLLRAKITGWNLALDEIRLDNVQTTDTLDNLPALLRLIGSFQKSLPGGSIQIEKMISDFATPYGDLRLETTLHMNTPDENGTRAVTALIKARQYQLSFDTKWSGTIAADGTVQLDADIVDGRLNIGPARLSRLAGWMSWRSVGDALPQLAGQIDAGSGTLFSLPLQNISLTIGGEENAIDMLFRTGLSGIDGVRLSLDSKITPTASAFNGALDIADNAAFFAYIQTLHPRAVPAAIQAIGPLQVKLDYREDRRFTGGPLPFAIEASSDGQRLLDGNILLYPNTLDLRGSAQMDENLAVAFHEYFGMAADKRAGGTLRLDGQLKKVLSTQPEEPAP